MLRNVFEGFKQPEEQALLGIAQRIEIAYRYGFDFAFEPKVTRLETGQSGLKVVSLIGDQNYLRAAGVRAGDVLIAVNGKPSYGIKIAPQMMEEMWKAFKEGTTLEMVLRLVRGAKVFDVVVRRE